MEKNKSNVPRHLRWTKLRLRQLQDFKQLLHTVGGLDRGSSFLNNTRKCIEIANRMMANRDLSGRNKCFGRFILDLAEHDLKLHPPKNRNVKQNPTK